MPLCVLVDVGKVKETSSGFGTGSIDVCGGLLLKLNQWNNQDFLPRGCDYTKIFSSSETGLRSCWLLGLHPAWKTGLPITAVISFTVWLPKQMHWHSREVVNHGTLLNLRKHWSSSQYRVLKETVLLGTCVECKTGLYLLGFKTVHCKWSARYQYTNPEYPVLTNSGYWPARRFLVSSLLRYCCRGWKSTTCFWKVGTGFCGLSQA